jgi:hypothetical protein
MGEAEVIGGNYLDTDWLDCVAHEFFWLAAQNVHYGTF